MSKYDSFVNLMILGGNLVKKFWFTSNAVRLVRLAIYNGSTFKPIPRTERC